MTKLHPPFLPKGGEHGWMPYLWLVYVLPFAVTSLWFGEWWPRKTLALAGLVCFLAVYFHGHWKRGRQVVPHIAALCVLGAAFAGQNATALVFFIYAGSFCAMVGEARAAWLSLAAVTAAEAVAVAAWGIRLEAWAAPFVFTLLVGAMVIHYAQRRRLVQRLLMTQGELERMAQIAERERIARDLHDLLGHTLSLIVLKSELASRLSESQPARAAEEIRDVERISREALSQVRAAVRGYRSSGLAAEVENARRALTAAGVELECEMERMDLTVAQEGMLALAIREAATNIVRHAKATRCRLWLRGGAAQCELEVADDGQGGAAVEGAGLRGMRERAEALGGTLEHDGTKGMRLLVRLPLGGAA